MMSIAVVFVSGLDTFSEDMICMELDMAYILGTKQDTISTVMLADDNCTVPENERTTYSTDHQVVYVITIFDAVTVDVVAQYDTVYDVAPGTLFQSNVRSQQVYQLFVSQVIQQDDIATETLHHVFCQFILVA